MRSILIAVILSCTQLHAITPSATQASPQAATGSQSASALLQGQVTDNSGALVAGATVTATSSNGASATATTDAEGKFTFPNLAPGAYTIVVNSPNFAPQKFEGFNVTAAGPNALEAQLSPATSTTNVEVNAQSATQIETDRSELAGTLSQKEVATFALNGRNFSQLLTLTPGVSNQTQQDEAKVGVVGSAKYSVNGGRTEYNSFDIDGSDVLNVGIAASRGHSTLSVYPSVDAIQEIKVLTSNYGAQYGRSASGTILVTTKSGGDKFHANAYEFLRNENFNARGFKDPAGPAPLYRRNDFGFTLGGPLYIPNLYNVTKEKTFFFFSEEMRLERSPSSFAQAVPSLNEREGNFSDVCPAVGGTYSAAKYPDCPHGSLVNTSNLAIDPNASAILHTNIIPIANSATGCTYSLSTTVSADPATWPCYNITVSPDTYWREELFRVDHNFNPSVKGSVRYIHDAWDTTTTAPQWQYNGVTNSFPTVLNRFTGPGLDLVAYLTTTRAPSLINDYSVGFVTQHITLKNVNGPGANLARPSQLDSACGDLITSCGIGTIFPDSSGKIPGLNLGGSNAAYGGTGFIADTSYQPWRNANPTISIRDDLSKQLGRHLIQAGVLFVDAQQSELSSATGANTGDVQGLLNYTNVTTSNLNTTGNVFADFLLANVQNNATGTPNDPQNPQGQIVSYQQDSGQQFYSNRYEYIEPYLQDDWKVTPRLTINAGVRVSFFGNWTPTGAKVYNFVPEKFDPSVASSISVDPNFGYLKNPGSGSAILASATAPDQRTINGLVQCGTGSTPKSCMSSHYFNPAPRVGFAWDPTGKGITSIRAGYGLFFEHGTGDEANVGSLTGSAPYVQSMTQNAPLGNSFRLECIDGRGIGCGATVPAGAAFPLDVSAIPTKVTWPYIQQWSFSVQHQIGQKTVASLAYVGSKGTHLANVRQLNQFDPVPAANNFFGPHEPLRLSSGAPNDVAACSPLNNPTAFETTTGYRYYKSNPAYVNLEIACSVGVNANSLRRYAGYGRILSIANLANSGYNAAQLTIHHVSGPTDIGLSYSFSHSIDEASDRFESAVGNSLDTASNRASSDFDERQILNITYILQLHLDKLVQRISDQGRCNDGDEACRTAHPYGSEHPSNILMKTAAGWELSGLTIFQTGTPFTVINGGSGSISSLDNAGVANGLGAGSYPDIRHGLNFCETGSGSTASSIVLGPVLGNRCNFAAPRGLTFGNAGRNFLNNPSRWNFDAALHRTFNTVHNSHVEVRVEGFNIFNHPQYRIFNPEKGNTASNTISCYGDETSEYSAGAHTCDAGNAFLRPVDAHRPRTLQLGVKMDF